MMPGTVVFRVGGGGDDGGKIPQPDLLLPYRLESDTQQKSKHREQKPVIWKVTTRLHYV